MYASFTRNKTAKKIDTTRLLEKENFLYLTSRGGSTSKRRSVPRKPIFDKADSLLSSNQSRFNTAIYSVRPAIEPKKLFSERFVTLDFCGCEKQVSPCEMFQSCLLKNVSLLEMKQEHNRIFKQNKTQKPINNIEKKFSKTLPQNYPSLSTSHLAINLSLMDGSLGWPQFSCLAWIQYHAKIEYVTYFIYQDLKHSFKNKFKFISNLHEEMAKLKGRHFGSRMSFSSQCFLENFDGFVSAYYESVGASLIPITHYAQFVKRIKQRGNKFLLQFLINFLTKRQSQLSKALYFSSLQGYRNFLSKLNWDSYFSEYSQ